MSKATSNSSIATSAAKLKLAPLIAASKQSVAKGRSYVFSSKAGPKATGKIVIKKK